MATLAVLAVSCKKDKDSALPVNTLTFDGVSSDIVEVYINESTYQAGKYDIYLLINGWSNMIDLMFSGESHLGKVIDLTEKDPVDYAGFWLFKYLRPGGPDVYACGNPHNAGDIVFDSGTLFTENLGEEDGAPIIHVELKNGKVKDENGASHTISLHFSGKFPLKGMY